MKKAIEHHKTEMKSNFSALISIVRVKFLLMVALLSAGHYSLAQEEEKDDIGTETVTVVKPFSPSVQDAFKIKQQPVLDDQTQRAKITPEYTIFSVPVASTFTPAKAKAATVDRIPPPKLYNTYASVGLGNYTNALADFYTSRSIGRGETLFDLGLSHFSSRGNIPSTPLSANFYNTDVDVSFSKKDRDFNWTTGVELGHKLYNWYGIEPDRFTESTINEISPVQNYFLGGLHGDIRFEDATFSGANLKLYRFWDAQNASEIRAKIDTDFDLDITTELLNVNLVVDYLGGEFGQSSLNEVSDSGAQAFGQLIAGVKPSLLILRDDLSINLGAQIVYNQDIENSAGNLYFYPAITASYILVPDKAIAFGGIEGGLIQNTYRDLVSHNPFVSPTLSLLPTDKQYDVSLGLKGQLFTGFGYSFKGFYRSENFKPLFFLNPINAQRQNEEDYAFGNSFQLFYDDIETFGVQASLNLDINEKFSFSAAGTYNSFETETDNPAWNLPELTVEVSFDYKINKQWRLGGGLFFVGERQDLQSEAQTNTPPNLFPSTIVTLDSFIDANLELTYQLNDQLGIFARASNLTNNTYQRWYNFEVQGFQALVGAFYKFDW